MIFLKPIVLDDRAQVEAQVLRICQKHPSSSAEIARAMGHKTLSGNLRKLLPHLREMGLLDYTIPDKPKSRLQKYRITEKGVNFLNKENSRINSQGDLK